MQKYMIKEDLYKYLEDKQHRSDDAIRFLIIPTHRKISENTKIDVLYL